MASAQVTGWTDLLLAKLSEKAKAYRIATINERIQGGLGTTTTYALNASNDVFRRKLEKVQNDHESVTWQFTKTEDGNGDYIIKAIAPVDRGGHTKVWGIVDGETGAVRPTASATQVEAHSLNDTHREAFFTTLNHLGTFWA